MRDPHLERALAVLATNPVFDGHNDLPWAIRTWADGPGGVAGGAADAVRGYGFRGSTAGHTDLPRLRAGRVGGQVWAAYISCELTGEDAKRAQLGQIAIAQEVMRANADELAEARSAADVRQALGEGRIASLLSMEGGSAVTSLDELRSFYEMGVRCLTLTHNCSHDWADAALDLPRHGGLSDFGREVVREMNRLGMLVDLSHASDATVGDAMKVARAPLLWSHVGARALVDHPRNVPDHVLAWVREHGGLVMATFVPAFVQPAHRAWDALEAAARAELERRHGRGDPAVALALSAWRSDHPPPRATLAQVADHVEHLSRVAGVDHVGIGSDFDGITRVVDGLEDVSTFPALFAELARRGWSDEALAKLASGNFLRVLDEVEAAARGSRDVV